jgi:hypothetical protein
MIFVTQVMRCEMVFKSTSNIVYRVIFRPKGPRKAVGAFGPSRFMKDFEIGQTA